MPESNPIGLHLAATDSQFHGNQGCGIVMSAGPGFVLISPGESNAMVGGTWHTPPPGGGPLTFNQSAAHFALRTGPGHINRCAISNNGEFGIYATAAAPTPQNNVVNCRVTNNVIWNNSLGGIFAQAGKGSGGPAQIPGNIKFLLPIIHNTIVGNGTQGVTNPYNLLLNSAEFSIEFYENLLSFGPQICHFEYDDPGVEDYATVVFKNILDTAGQGSADFGPGLRSTFGKAYTVVAPIPTGSPLNLGVDSNRAVGPTGLAEPFNSILDIVPYLYGSPNLSLYSAPQFFLLHAGPSGAFSNATPFTQFGVNETILDYSSVFRDPVVPGNFPVLPEMGADELP